MAPISLRKLIALQTTREAEMQSIRTRLMDKAHDSLNRSMIQARLDAVRDIWSEARRAHAEIVVREDAETDAYVADNWFERIQGVYEGAQDEILTLMALFERSENGSNVSDAPPGGRGAKLPHIPLPSFSGNYEDWASFCDLFTALVHDVPRLSDATKLQYLKLCLTGRAAELVKDVSTTDANYAGTWKSLSARYHNPRLIINNLLSSFMELPHLRREAAAELRSLIDEAQRIFRALGNMELPVEHWDVWLVFLLADRMDPESRRLWETELSERDQEAGREEEGGDTKRAQALSMLTAGRRGEKRLASAVAPGPQARKVFHASPARAEGSLKCIVCSGSHLMTRCPKFRDRTVRERYSLVRRLQVCYNCFGAHRVSACPSAGRCSVCQCRHHTLLHLKPQGPPQASPRAGEPRGERGADAPNPVVSLHAASGYCMHPRVILATARVLVIAPSGVNTYARALLDQGSEASFVSEKIVQLLQLPKQRTWITLSGLGVSAAGTARLKTRLRLGSSVDASFQLGVEALVLPRLTAQLPSGRIDHVDFKQFAGITLADPRFFVPGQVDVILGAEAYGEVLRPGLKRFSPGNLVAQDTVFGWVVSGATQTGAPGRAGPMSPTPAVQTLHCAPTQDLDQALRRFWELEDMPSIAGQLKAEDALCERIFKETHRRDDNGRYQVHLPLKPGVPLVGSETRRMALGSLASLHRRLARDDRVAAGYREFMEHYERLGHMTRIPAHEVRQMGSWYLPHHPVVHASASAWKLRVVFDASRRTQEGHCLNHFVFTGAPLQGDLSLILLNWRRYRFAFTADIVKMFRQIDVRREDQDFQRIVWSPSAETEPGDYRLTTVTYGTACAPFLAIRTLEQLAEDEGSRFPLGAACLRNETYVDDTFAGADEVDVAVQKRVQLTELLRSAGIELDKWAANHPALLPPRAHAGTAKEIDADDRVKTLGVQWVPGRDQFHFHVSGLEDIASASTKRAILSNIARLFDPLGWLSPVTVVAKILMQDLWIRKCEWDTPLPDEFRERWAKYCDSLSQLPRVAIDRWLGAANSHNYQLHGFSDSSSRAYAAVVYLRVDRGDGEVQVTLLAAKTKVAPVKTVSIPNLELCGAALLVRLLGHVRQLSTFGGLPVFAWSDSQIVLTWLRKHPCHWKAFVANRVSFIQTELPSAVWAHVPTKENPADLATRGSSPAELAGNGQWWHGPPWLARSPEHWPQPTEAPRVLHARALPIEPDLLRRFSSYTRLVRVVAYCRRLLIRVRRRRGGQETLPPFLTSSELAEARCRIIRLSQAARFAEEIEILESGGQLSRGNSLAKLGPFVDGNHVLRVGGRLEHAALPYEQRHPPILSAHSALSLLLARHAHRLCLHGGPTLTACTLLRQAWILGRSRLVKSVVHRCVTCQRVKPRLAQQMMGDLPAERTTPGRPFATAGLDYAGPVQVRTTKGRGHRSYKGYIVVIVCFVTRAVHLELVSDLTTASFLSAYRRFVGRRGLCQRLLSDNATNFHGADKELKAMFNRASEYYREVAAALAQDGTDWSFIPPNSPHYGGLWEAGVKSVKHHLKRVVGEHTLTFEELSTVLVEIEACLNSRPLGALSSEPEDLQALTPAHFLQGGVAAVLPDAEPPSTPLNRLDRFQLLQRLRGQFWRRWSSEYLLHLQERGKWRTPSENFCVGRLVVVRDDRYPPAKWALGRITEVFPGPDGLVRVAQVKTATTSLRRHIARLCPLQLEENGRGRDTHNK